MKPFDPADHPRGDGGRFKANTRTEPEGGLGTEPASTPKTFRDGWVEWRTPDEVLHRLDGPAVVTADGTGMWYQHGAVHRVGGPAVIRPDGTEEWWFHDRMHREDGPAFTAANGDKEWLCDSQYHRTDGPAIMRTDGTREWWEHGERKPPEVEAMLTLVWRAKNGETSTQK